MSLKNLQFSSGGWFEVGSECVPGVNPLPLQVQHLLPVAHLYFAGPTHPGEDKLGVNAAALLVNFELLPP